MDEHKIRTEYVNRDRQVISNVLKNRFYPGYVFWMGSYECRIWK